MALAFPHHAAQENTAPEACAKSAPARRVRSEKPGNAVAESENIVAETAEKIFSDLADAQTINSDKKGAWKAPLWQALTEAGLPLAWVGEDCGGSGASLAEGFGVLGAAGRFAIQLQGRPSRSNPKTSALAAMSVARALLNERATIVI